MQALVLVDDKVDCIFDAAKVREAVAAGHTLWLDLTEKNETAMSLLTDTFGLHSLVVEDIFEDRALPKVEEFDGYLFLLVHSVHEGSNATNLKLVELDIVIGPTWVITHHHGSPIITAARNDCTRSSRIMKKGPAWIVHSILDHLVDQYVPFLDDFDTRIDSLQDEIMEKAGTPEGTGLMSKMFGFKRSLQGLRRAGVYQREILLRLSRGEFDEIPADALHFFRDVYDHFARINDLADSYRDLVASGIEAYLSVQSNRMNEVMKALTLISTVMLPLTFIAGVYGMNFEHMPELKWLYGYPYALGLMVLVAVGIFYGFRRKRWV